MFESVSDTIKTYKESVSKLRDRVKEIESKYRVTTNSMDRFTLSKRRNLIYNQIDELEDAIMHMEIYVNQIKKPAS